MNNRLQRELAWLAAEKDSLLAGRRIGLEKESLRGSTNGMIAQTDHPAVLGAAMTHPCITTDFSEALLEFVTPPMDDAASALAFLTEIHQFLSQSLHDEFLWAGSMPCVVDGDASIPIARYGSSNLGQFKHIYRRGLGHRYGKVMQVIAGVHFNYSLPDAFWPALQAQRGDSGPLQDFISDAYFGLIRNVQRYGWLLVYLFGSSPAVCKSFLGGHPHTLQEYDRSTLFLPYATSLRMSDIGYTNKKRCGLQVRYDDLQTYVDGLRWAVTTPCLPYQIMKVQADGQYRQLNSNVLQIENEYYSVARPKQLPEKDERPLQALQSRGVRYVELRSLDVGLFDPVGVNEPQMRFVEAFLIYCLLQESPAIDEDERSRLESNQNLVAGRGREPALQLAGADGPVTLQESGLSICESMAGIAERLDQASPGGNAYAAALATQTAALSEPELTPSARLLAAMRASGQGFFHFAKEQSEKHRNSHRATPLPAAVTDRYQRMAAQSLQEQAALEESDTVSLAQYLEKYFARLD